MVERATRKFKIEAMFHIYEVVIEAGVESVVKVSTVGHTVNP